MEFLKNLFQKKAVPEQPSATTLAEIAYKAFAQTKNHNDVIDTLEPNERKSFYVECQNLAKNEVLQRVIDDLVRDYAEEIIQRVETEDLLKKQRYLMLGVDKVRSKIIEYAERLEKQEEFNQYEVI